MAQTQTILNLAAEGGGLTILGTKKGGQWLFQLVTNDDTWLLAEDELIEEAPVGGGRGWVNSLPEALAQIEWPWNCFHPTEMHPEFAAEILILKKLKDAAGPTNSYADRRWDMFVT